MSIKMRLVLVLLLSLPFLTFAHDVYIEAQVLEVQPVYVQNKVFRGEQCRSYNNRDYGDFGGVNVVGAIIGGAIGNQFGGGSGREISTAVGAVIGGAYRPLPPRHYARTEYTDSYIRNRGRHQEICTPIYDYVRQVGYYVVKYQVDGNTYFQETTTLPSQNMLIQRQH